VFCRIVDEQDGNFSQIVCVKGYIGWINSNTFFSDKMALAASFR
jgi:hypothetical protein